MSRAWMAACCILGVTACGGAPKRPRTVQADRPAAGEEPLATRPRSILSTSAIEDIQRSLSARGYEVDVSSAFDHSTERAIRRFQEQHGLAATGMPDLATLRRLGLDAIAIYEDSLQR